METMAIIIGAIIGGSSTIAAAFITRGYVVRRASNINYKLSGFVKAFINFFSAFKISNAKYYRLKENTVYTDEKLNLTFITPFRDTNFFKNQKLKEYIKWILPTKEVIELDLYSGSHTYFNIKETEYRIMILTYWHKNKREKDYHIAFELRDVSVHALPEKNN